MNDATTNILLVEDHEDHVFLTKRAPRNSGLPLQISVTTDGDEAVA